MAGAAYPHPIAVCSYCGCRAITVIGRLSNEHVEIINATGALRRAALAEDGDAAATAGKELTSLLGSHTTGEERGLFAELRLDPEFADHIDVLCAEHREINAHLARLTNGDPSGVVALETLLRRHIDKEENGMFPAAAVALDGQAWERIEQRAP
jgi:hemerythrin-like domain-containing protein